LFYKFYKARRGKLETANKLTVLYKTKQEKGVLFGPNSSITKQKKCEKWKEVIELAESIRLAVAEFSRQTVAGADPDFVGPKVCITFWTLLKKKKSAKL
jgi:hypothetical protein